MVDCAKPPPRLVTGIIAIFEVLLTAAIIGLEVYSCYLDLAHGTIWAGLWSGIVFIITIIMTLFITCCCRNCYCALYVLVLQIISLALCCVIIYFDQYFMNDVCKCYLGDQLCCAVGSIPQFQSNFTAVLEACGTAIINGNVASLTCRVKPVAKIVYIQAQLGCAAGMLLVCLIAVIFFVISFLGVFKK